MMMDVRLPELGEGVTEGELLKWLVKPGDEVEVDQNVAEVMTDKATVEVPSPKKGRVMELKFKIGDMIPTESVLLTLEVIESSASSVSASTDTSSVGTVSTAVTSESGVSVSGSKSSLPPSPSASAAVAGLAFVEIPPADPHVLATPATRRLAREMGVDINEVQGSGIVGRVTRDDVLKTASPVESGSFPGTSGQFLSGVSSGEERIPLRGIRKKIAETMQMAKSIVPHFTIMDEADITSLVNFRESLKAWADSHQTKITYLPFVMKALVLTCREFPQVNASIDDKAQEIVYKKYYNVGFAADTPNGLVVPVVRSVDGKSVADLGREILDLSKRARDGKLKAEEMKGATVTITNIGSVGGTYATPIINHPEVAILGMYKIMDKVVPSSSTMTSVTGGGLFEVRKVMNFTLTADHRLIDGAVAARFLKALIGRLENPAQLMVELR